MFSSCFCFTQAACFPVGYIVDAKPSSALWMIFGGLLTFSVGYFCLGPFRMGSGEDGVLAKLDRTLDNAYAVGFGMFCIAVGNTLTIVPALPALYRGKSEEQQAALSGTYLAVYATGSVLGPIVASALLQLKLPFLCRSWDAQRPGAVQWTTAADCSEPDSEANPSKHEHCECFDGMATLMSLMFAAMATVFGAWVCCRHLCLQKTKASGR